MPKKITLVLFILIFITFVLRIWRLEELFHFTYDEEIIAFVGKRMFINGHIPLIGGVTPFHVHLAPYFYWISGLFLFISKLNPLGWGVVAALIACLTVWLLFITTKKLFSEKTAFVAIIFYIFSFYQNVFDRHYWGLIFNGLFSLVTIFSLHQLIHGKQKYLYLLMIILALGFHTDPSTFVLCILSVFVIWYFKPKISRKTYLTAGAFFLFSFLPLIVFDIRHQFVNGGGFFQYVQEIQVNRTDKIIKTLPEVLLFMPQALGRLLYIFGDTDLAKQYSYCPKYALSRLRDVPFWLIGIVIVVFAIVLLTKLKKSNRNENLVILLFLFFSTFIGITIYGFILQGDLFDHYLSTLFPAFYMLLAFVFTHFFVRKRLLLFLILFTFIFFNLNLLQNVSHRFGYKNKIEAVSWAISQTGNQEFSVDVMGNCFRYNGYRYLFYLQGKEPIKSYVDANLSYLFDKSPALYHPPLLVVITNSDWIETQLYYDEYKRYKLNEIESKQFGDIEVMIIDNSKLDYVGKF